GAAKLRAGGSALDAAIAAAVVLEDDPVFNAGTGSGLTLDGEIEVDACVMDGATRRAGAVAAVRDVRNPVLPARRVMAETDHVLLKLPGRIGDTPIPGAGTYAAPAGAASATGHGELAMHALTTKLAVDAMATADAATAVRVALDATRAATGSADLGLICVDA